MGLITPTSGKIYINDIILEPKNRIELLTLINFASPYIELPKKLTVKQNLEIYGRLYGVSNLRDRVNEISSDLDIKEFFERKTGELSSGQKNRVSLAKSLINKPEVLLLDEPFSALDVLTIKMLQEIIVNLQQENKITICICDHQARDLLSCVDRAIVLSNGKIIASINPIKKING